MNTLYLVRHGEFLANITKEFSYKKVDYPLTAKGRLQAAQTAEYFAALGANAIYSSPLKRAVETGSVIGARLNLPVWVHENIRELNVGRLEDMGGSEEAWQINNQVIADWFEGRYESSFPDGEDFHSARNRIVTAVREICAQRDNQKIILIGHGGIFFAALCGLCPQVSPTYLMLAQSHNCSITEIQIDTRSSVLDGQLIRWADTGHLNGEAAQFVIPYRQTQAG
jgi:broad specificity phosphatase PhoE